MQTQNRVTLAEPRLPREVVLQGLQVAKVNSGFLMARRACVRKDNSVPSDVLNNIVSAQVLDPIQRIPGVGRRQQFGSAYSMRIWLNPDKLRSFRMSAAECCDRCAARTCSSPPARSAQRPSVPGQQVTAPVSGGRRSSAPMEEFENVILRTEPNGTSVRLKDVARVELGLSDYSASTCGSTTSRSAASACCCCRARMRSKWPTRSRRAWTSWRRAFPPGVEWFLPFDATIVHQRTPSTK